MLPKSLTGLLQYLLLLFQLFGFFGGIHWAILAAYICEKHPNASVNTLLTVFFETFSQWQWPKPVILQDRSIPYRDPDGRSLMPIMMPCSPFEFCNSNVTRSTFNKIRTELLHGYVLTRVCCYSHLNSSSISMLLWS